MLSRFLSMVFLFGNGLCYSQVMVPIYSDNRGSVNVMQLTSIGEFGVIRKARTGIPKHLHTGIDIQRPNETNRLIYPIAKGVVISKRTDGPYAQLIIEHVMDDKVFWTVYEHIGSIRAHLYQEVNPEQPIAAFFSNQELDRFGWQFNHVHFEILKERPLEIKPSPQHPERLYKSYTLICYDQEDLNTYFYNPLVFLEAHF